MNDILKLFNLLFVTNLGQLTLVGVSHDVPSEYSHKNTT
jgi:hypothetical protein